MDRRVLVQALEIIDLHEAFQVKKADMIRERAAQ
jgi:hypothetical protein